MIKKHYLIIAIVYFIGSLLMWIQYMFSIGEIILITNAPRTGIESMIGIITILQCFVGTAYFLDKAGIKPFKDE